MYQPRVSAEYAAGFFDGEGSVSIRRKNAPSKGTRWWAMTISVSQNDPRPLEALQARWGGIVSGPRVNGQHEWRLGTLAAETFLRDIEPHCIVKREQVQIALEYRTGVVQQQPGCKGLPQAEHDRREHLRAALSAARKSYGSAA